jgi:hypothetical protein
VEIVVGLANKGEQESTPWLRFSSLGCSATIFALLDRAANLKLIAAAVRAPQGGLSILSPLLVLSPREKAELFHGGSSNERLRSQSLAGNVSRSTAREGRHSILTGDDLLLGKVAVV